MLGSPTPDPAHRPGGLIVIMRTDPVAAARALAREHGVEVTTGGAATAEAIAWLTDRADVDPSPGPAHDETNRRVSHPSGEVTSTERPTTVAITTDSASAARRPTDAELDDLATGMRRADALRDRTRQQVADDLCHSLNSSLAIHPDTLRRAADELIDATQAVALARDGRSPGAKKTRTSQAGTVGAAGAFGAAAAAVGLVVAWPAGLAMAGVGAASGLARHRTIRRNVRQQLPGLEADEALARRRWERVAGSGADPTDLEAVIRRYDPRTEMVSDLLAHHPAVRAVQRMADERRRAWVGAWQVAVDDPLSARSLIDRTSSDETLADETLADETSKSGESSEPTSPGVVVVVSPYDGLTEVEAHDLHDRLLELHTDVEVIVVLGKDVLDDVDGPPPSAAVDDDDDGIDHRQELIIDLTGRSVRQWPIVDPISSAHARR